MAPSAIGRAAAAWGIGGVVLFIGHALLRLVPIAVEGLRLLEGPLAWTALAVWVLLMAWAEGWRGFHRRFSPRVVARAVAVMRDPRPARVLLAPLFCMSLFGASRRGLVVGWTLVVGIVLLVALVRSLDQPWRGAIDAGVVVGLALGVSSIGWHAVRAVRGTSPPVDPDLG